ALLTLEISVNSSVLFSGNRIFAFADSKNTVDETDENNNIKHNMADCEFVPPVGTFNPVKEWQWTGSDANPTSNQVMCAPVVANLNDDNGDGAVDNNDTPDIIFNSFVGWTYLTGGTLRAVSGDGSGEVFSVTGYSMLPVASPAVGDIDSDGLPEIIAVGSYDGGYGIIAFENDGVFKWKSEIIHTPADSSSVTLSDINEDGVPDIIYADTVINNDGTVRWRGGLGDGNRNSCVADIDLQGHPELVAGNTAYRSDGTVYWHRDDLYDGLTAIGNFNADPYPEIVLVNGPITGNWKDKKVYLLKHSGETIWGPVSVPGTGGGVPVIADFDNDGDPEIGVAGASYYVVFESDGTEKWKSGTSDYSSAGTGSSVFDFEGDGRSEVVYADENQLRIYDGNPGAETGKVLFNITVGSGTGRELPVIADVDNDNNAEIVVVSNTIGNSHGNNGIFVFGDADDSWVNTRKIWNQYSYHITNVNDDGTIPRVEANNWETFNNYRQNQMLNPFGCIDLTGSRVRADKSGYPDSVKITARFGNGGALHIAPGAAMS
ncbi:MAG: VCBS repeat-containing protein, partial [Desulfobacteraceae bacterium]|nr:VCBS repeat-containing protein [Desulfobacteraceae bacterium]